ncbi:MAG: hypothetical protein AAF225_12055 [Pseudomonadota bacterium]
MARAFALLALALLTLTPAKAGIADFDEPVDVALVGYSDHAMEPFLSRDGKWMFFNNRNRPGDQTDLHVASRINATRFLYRGPLEAANSLELDGVPSVDIHGNFYFISPRSYDESKNTLWTGRLTQEGLGEVRPLMGNIPRREALWFNIDAEISADGSSLYVVESRRRLFGGGIRSANILVAERANDGSFQRPDNWGDLFAAINTSALEFAPATTRDELILYFTRADTKALRSGDPNGFGIFVATRPSQTAPFGTPQRIQSIAGYVEAPTVSPDECAIYFHKEIDGLFRLQMAKRQEC